MYVTIEEAASYLEIDETKLRQLILQNKIRVVYYNQVPLINTQQFDTHLKEMERIRREIQAYLNEPIPESLDVKDED
ncbi:DNA binding domain-containing protein, excisionase family [Pelagirhabdus alkalitolerans]|uniref:DNA binding domain-containing protein, excisionase family n=1 Tax=Pelagirhabdus alkalitolerans TaxID=1612202 RepID=A0A1G6KIB0_9BACI|nr:hypothetical protein [Pelagirhabdus alkalitolerans]SDC30723.1 DNA binding domain-containing protein, excisionase family [Pelagirhabdus alkalitolerans]